MEYLILKRPLKARIYHAVDPETMLGRCDGGRIHKNWNATPGAEVTCPKCLLNITAGVRRSPTYECWNSMRNRCKYPSHISYKRYGALGIKVCERWDGRGGFANFLADMGERPEGMTLDRIDGKKDYSPDNCRWATMSTQLRNRASLKRYTAFGKSQLIIEWCEEYGAPVQLVHGRIKNGWPLERALTTPKLSAADREARARSKA